MGQTLETRDYSVHGMTCGHCALSVRQEVSEIPGVDAVDVDLLTGRLSVSGADLRDDAVLAAVDAAGYEVAA